MPDNRSSRMVFNGPMGWVLAWMFALSLTGAIHAEEDFWQEAEIEVNEGELEFLSQAPEKPVHHHQNLIIITQSSLQNGWVELAQCHRHLDPVPRLEIVYHAQRIRALRIVSFRNIGRAEVVGHKLELAEISRGAEICLTAQSRALHSMGDGVYQLRNGPYMRRFLDGYYPMQLSLEVHYPSTDLQFYGQRPLPVGSVEQKASESFIKWQGWFSGKLSTEIDFKVIDG